MAAQLFSAHWRPKEVDFLAVRSRGAPPFEQELSLRNKRVKFLVFAHTPETEEFPNVAGHIVTNWRQD